MWEGNITDAKQLHLIFSLLIYWNPYEGENTLFFWYELVTSPGSFLYLGTFATQESFLRILYADLLNMLCVQYRWSYLNIMYTHNALFFFFFMLERASASGGGWGQRERETENLKQALHCHHKT